MMRGRGRYVAASAFALVFGGAAFAVQANAQSPQQAVVSASTAWAQAGITVKRGAKLQISAKGVWSIGPAARGDAGPVGYSGQTSRLALLPSANVGALVGRIGAQGSPFLVGANYDGAASADGQLYLSINDDSGAFGDNQGRLSVSIVSSAPSASTNAQIAPKATRPSPTLNLPAGAATGPNVDRGARAPAATRNPNTPSGGSSPSIGADIPLSAIAGAIFGGRKPSTTPPSVQPPITAPSANPPPTRTPPTTSTPPTRRPTVSVTPPSVVPPTRPPTRSVDVIPPRPRPPSVTPPVALKPPAALPSISPERVVDRAPLEVVSTKPLPEPLAPTAPETPNVTPPPPAAPAPPPLIPAAWVAPAAIGGGALLLFLLFGPMLRGKGKSGGADAPRITSRIVSDGRADQSLSVKWKGR